MIANTLETLIKEINVLVKNATTLAVACQDYRKEIDDLKKAKEEKDFDPTLKDLRQMAKYIVDTDDDVLGITIKVEVKDPDADDADGLFTDLYGKDEKKGGEE